jgi:hypothetical protein
MSAVSGHFLEESSRDMQLPASPTPRHTLTSNSRRKPRILASGDILSIENLNKWFTCKTIAPQKVAAAPTTDEAFDTIAHQVFEDFTTAERNFSASTLCCRSPPSLLS